MAKRGKGGRFVKTTTVARAPRGRRARATQLVRYQSRAVTHRRPAARRRSRGRAGGAGGVKIVPLALATVAVAYLAGPKGPEFVRKNVMKIPGAKTFGPTAMLGLGCLAADRFVKPNRWLRLAGYAGLVLAATQLGQQGSDFKFVGEDDDVGYDVEGDDYGEDEDVEGDDE